MADGIILVFDEDKEFPHKEGRWAPFTDEAVPPSPTTLEVHISRTRGGRIHRCACGQFHQVVFDDKGATVATWTQPLAENGEAAPKKPRGPPF